MNILISGSRTWSTPESLYNLFATFEDFPDVHIIQGGAGGVDKYAQEAALHFGYRVTTVPAQWDKYGRSAGHRRNAQMLNDFDIHLAFAFLDDRLQYSAGTEGMIDLLRKSSVHYHVFKYTEVS